MSGFNSSTPSLSWLFHYFHLQSMRVERSVLSQSYQRLSYQHSIKKYLKS